MSVSCEFTVMLVGTTLPSTRYRPGASSRRTLVDPIYDAAVPGSSRP